MANPDFCSVDFRTYGEDRGAYYDETGRCLIYLSQHEDLNDIFKTIQHEVIHFCFSKLNEIDDMDEDQEEKLIFFIAWAELAL
tara:strand:+ start:121 stop:369 length:249 start_codon:yes stop_codon:yes gene_type:complete